MKDAELAEDNVDKSISEFSLSYIGARTLSFQVAFGKPGDICDDLQELDYIEVKLLMPWLIIDAQSLDTMQADEATVSLQCQP